MKICSKLAEISQRSVAEDSKGADYPGLVSSFELQSEFAATNADSQIEFMPAD